MNVVKIYKYNTGTYAFVLNKVERVLSCNYNKKINEMGQINLVLDYESVAEVEDFIEIFLAEKRLATGYIAEINKSKTSVTVVALTEEYKLAKCIMPTEYTQNVTGLTLETLAKMISRRYWQVRWMDRTDFLDSSKIISSSGKIKDVLGGVYTGQFTKKFAYEVIKYEIEYGSYKDLGTFSRAYDRVATLSVHPLTMDVASAVVDDYSAVTDFNISNIIACDFFQIKFEITDETGATVIFEKNNNIVSSASSIFAGLEVVNIHNCLIKVYLVSSASNFQAWESVLLSGSYPTTVATPTCKGNTLEFLKVRYPSAGLYSGTKADIVGKIKTTTGIFANQIIERVRWEEPIIENYFEYYSASDKSSESINRVKFLFDINSQIVESSFKFPNEFTFRAGCFLEPFHPVSGGEYVSSDLDFYIYGTSSSFNSAVLPKEDAVLVVENMINTEYVKAIEFILYQRHLANPVVAAALQNVRPTQFEMNGNTNYDVLRDICDESQARFKVEDDVLTISEKGAGTPTSFILHDEINCTIDTVKISDEQLFNFQYLEGQGDGVLNKPLVEVRTATKDKKTRKSLPIVKTEQKTKAELNTFATLYNSALNTTTKLINIKTTYTQIDKTLVKEGDIIKAIHNGVTYENLEVEEVTYNLTEEDAEIIISAGNSNKKLT
jgi:hypothetical protein